MNWSERVNVELEEASLGLALWAAAIVWWGLGDLATTHMLWQTPGFEEQSHTVGAILTVGGTPAHALWKGVMLGSLAVYYRHAPAVPWCPERYDRAYRYTIPAGVAAVGMYLTVSNYALIA